MKILIVTEAKTIVGTSQNWLDYGIISECRGRGEFGDLILVHKKKNL